RTSRISESMLRGLRIFQKDYPSAKSFFLYGGKRRYYEGNITILPIEEALLKFSDIL
ncbi:MAG: ATPase, partial [Candidatus Omnitrophica bacterium CG12_big_fil_rev_8_21_14_0_65_50_5]